jgi:AraC-like DNA-binding protein
MRYRELLPAMPLRTILRCCWSVRGAPDSAAAPSRVLPDGCADLIFDLAAAEPQAHWIGTMTRAVVVPAGENPVDLFGLRFAPGGLHAVLARPLSAFTDQRVACADAPAAWARGLAERLAVLPSLTARLRCVEAALSQVRPDTEALQATAALAALERDPLPAGIGDLASRWGYTERTLERRFDAWIGVRPKQHLRYLRFASLLPRLLAGGATAALAADSGYADQSHLIREVRAFSGVPPRELLREHAARHD